MFMGKTELMNMKKLLKIRIRDSRGLYTISSLLLVSFLIGLTNMIKTILTYNTKPELISASVYSNWAMLYMIIACIYYTFQYSEFYEMHQIFPQTGASRFYSFELYIYRLHVITQAIALGCYLLQTLIYYILSRSKGNLAFVYSFDPVYITTGFFAYLLYGFILISFIILIASLVRLFRWWTIVTTIGCIFILWITGTQGVIRSIIILYLCESSILILFIKLLFTWLLLELANHFINARISIIKTGKFLFRHIMIASVLILTFFLSSFININSIDENDYSPFYYKDINLSKDKPYCVVDAASLPSQFSLQTCIDYKQQGVYDVLYGNTYRNKTDNKIQIYFIPQHVINENIDLTAFTHLKLKASLRDKKLFIQILEDKNVKVLSIYPYSLIAKLDCFKDKTLASKYTGKSYGNTLGKLVITTPENKNINIEKISYEYILLK